MDYIEVKIFSKDKIAQDILISDLADIGFESFESDQDGIKAYIQVHFYSQNKLNALLESSEYLHQEKEAEIKQIPSFNWNAAWEEAFEPIEVDNKLLIHAPFHDANTVHPLKIVIKPRMSFGTGHHATTRLMCSCMLLMDWTKKTVLDMGSGTGILAILAKKLGAAQTDAVDNEEWAVENALENASLNHVEIQSMQGESGNWSNDTIKYDIILANINRNIIVRDLKSYLDMLSKTGEILLSGFLTTDEKYLATVLENNGMHTIEKKSEGEWLMLRAGRK
ncbi:MAG: 50S ribosomal protein L11 methyltransferase [Flavobacteriales bacterium]